MPARLFARKTSADRATPLGGAITWRQTICAAFAAFGCVFFASASRRLRAAAAPPAPLARERGGLPRRRLAAMPGTYTAVWSASAPLSGHARNYWPARSSHSTSYRSGRRYWLS
jgi:hypothetical protein